MSAFIYLLIIVIYFVFDYILANFMKQVAYAKGYDDRAHAWALTFWFGPIGFLYVISLPDLVLREQNKEIISLLKGEGGSQETEKNEQLPTI